MERLALATFNAPPLAAASLKYDEFAATAGERLRRQARRQGLPLLDQAPDFQGAAPCWGKLTVLLQALTIFECVLWVDSDALVNEGAFRLSDLMSVPGDIIAQEPTPWFERTRLSPERGLLLQPVNTGVFAVRRAATDLLDSALALAQPLAARAEWNGLGDQEALARIIRATGAASRISYVAGLQLPPAACGEASFTHYFGDRAEYRYPERLCRAVVRALAGAPRLGAREQALLHWCAIQRRTPGGADRGGPDRFGYEPEELDAALREFLHERPLLV